MARRALTVLIKPPLTLANILWYKMVSSPLQFFFLFDIGLWRWISIFYRNSGWKCVEYQSTSTIRSLISSLGDQNLLKFKDKYHDGTTSALNALHETADQGHDLQWWNPKVQVWQDMTDNETCNSTPTLIEGGRHIFSQDVSLLCFVLYLFWLRAV